MVNRVFLVGNLTRDAEPIDGAQSPVTRLRVATNVRWRNTEGVMQEATEFHSVVAFGRTAEVAAAYGHRGRQVYVEGHLKTREYDGSDGLRRRSTDVVADVIRLLGHREHAPAEAEEPALATTGA